MAASPSALILAAGASRRFGSDKRLARLADGTTMLNHSIATVQASGLPFAVVLRAGEEHLAGAAKYCIASHAEQGMGSSIADAVAQLDDGSPGCLILPFDLPQLQADSVLRVAEALTTGTIVQPRCDGRSGHPVAFAAEFFPELRRLRGDSGAREVLRRHRDCVRRLTLNDSGIYRDVDTPAQLQALQGSAS